MPDEQPPERLDYPSAKVKTPRPSRAMRSWMLLIVVWGAGLIVWTIYIIAIIYLLTKIF